MTTGARKVRATHIRAVVADDEWQALRAGLVGRWMRERTACTDELERYFRADTQNPWRVRRVLNYLTGSAFRLGIIHDDRIAALRDEVRIVWADLIRRDVDGEQQGQSDPQQGEKR